MERLTECVGYRNDKPIYKTKIDMRKIGSVDKLKNKLGEYEDLEEQGMLLKTPCKVGTYIYMINHYWIDEGRICGIAEADDIDCFCFKVCCEPDNYTVVAITEFNKTWFLTKEEAEKKLQIH